MIATRVVVLALLAACLTVSASQAQDAEKAFYAGKTVRMIVGSGVGGGYDVFSRLMGEDVDSRKTFIQENAKDVRFLDI